MKRFHSLTWCVALAFAAARCSDSDEAKSSAGSGGAAPGTGGAIAGTLATGGTPAQSGTSATGGQGTGAFAEVQSILQKSCSTCHNGKGDSIDRVNLSNSDGSAALYERLTTPIPDTIAKCQGISLVDPQVPAASLLGEIIETNIDTPGCIVPRMPHQCTDSGLPRACLSAFQITAVHDWITAGAPAP